LESTLKMPKKRNGPRLVVDALLALGAVALTTNLCRFLETNPATTAISYLIMVLGIAVWRGFSAGTVASLAAAASFNYYFLPPIGTFTVADPANWVALAAFLIASTVASQLVVKARVRADEAEARRRELEGLYDLSLDLFASTSRVGALPEAAARALRTLGARGGGLLLVGGKGRPEQFFSLGEAGLPANDPLLDTVRRTGEAVEIPAAGDSRDVYLPLVVGGHRSGILVAQGTRSERAALESVASLVALAVERESFLLERSHLEALQESDRLKTSILRAVSHDLRTPLTAIRLAADSLERNVPSQGEAGSALKTVQRELEHLSHRIDNLLSLARLEAGVIVPRPEPTPAADLFRGVREALPLVLEGRLVKVHVTDDCPDVLVDPHLAVEILANLVENAARCAPLDSALELEAGRHPLEAQTVILDVLDRGPGLSANSGSFRIPIESDRETVSRVKEPRRGLGLEIARGLAEASAGDVTMMARPGGGTTARLSLPAAPEPREEDS
jgi:two-component system sensor histidine kinase KdpD